MMPLDEQEKAIMKKKKDLSMGLLFLGLAALALLAGYLIKSSWIVWLSTSMGLIGVALLLISIYRVLPSLFRST